MSTQVDMNEHVNSGIFGVNITIHSHTKNIVVYIVAISDETVTRVKHLLCAVLEENNPVFKGLYQNDAILICISC